MHILLVRLLIPVILQATLLLVKPEPIAFVLPTKSYGIRGDTVVQMSGKLCLLNILWYQDNLVQMPWAFLKYKSNPTNAGLLPQWHRF